MKFKFRADPDDLAIFIVFAIFLLFIVALGVANVSSFANTGQLSGLNPLPAFAPDHIFSTVVFYLVALLGLLANVDSSVTIVGLTDASAIKNWDVIF